MQTKSEKIEEEVGNETANSKPCSHFMVWHLQGGYSYYRCSLCDYIDGLKTFKDWKKRENDGSGYTSELNESRLEGKREALEEVVPEMLRLQEDLHNLHDFQDKVDSALLESLCDHFLDYMQYLQSELSKLMTEKK